MRLTIVALTALGIASVARAISADELHSGVAAVEITPPLGHRMSGYFYERPNTGTHDPLMAKALVVAQGEMRAAIVFCDLIGLSSEVSTQARQGASRRTGIPVANIAILATHSHTGPLYFGVLRKHFHERAIAQLGQDPREKVDYPAELIEKITEAIVRADQAIEPVALSAGVYRQEPHLSFNRRFHMKDGSVRFNPGQQNPDIVRSAGPIDPDVGVLSFAKKSNDGPLAVCTVFAMHLDTVGGTEYSADYPYYLEKGLRARLGQGVVSLFAAGTCGDINHIDVLIQGRRSAVEIGDLLSATVEAGLPQLAAVVMPSLAVRSATVEAPLQRYTAEKVSTAAAKIDKVGNRELPFLEEVEVCKILAIDQRAKTLFLEVQVFRLSKDLAIVTLPGEVFVELGLAIKQASPFGITLVAELANDTPAYIPTKKAFAEGSYETVNSIVEPGGGEMLVEAATRLLKELVP